MFEETKSSEPDTLPQNLIQYAERYSENTSVNLVVKHLAHNRRLLEYPLKDEDCGIFGMWNPVTRTSYYMIIMLEEDLVKRIQAVATHTGRKHEDVVSSKEDAIRIIAEWNHIDENNRKEVGCSMWEYFWEYDGCKERRDRFLSYEMTDACCLGCIPHTKWLVSLEMFEGRRLFVARQVERTCFSQRAVVKVISPSDAMERIRSATEKILRIKCRVGKREELATLRLSLLRGDFTQWRNYAKLLLLLTEGGYLAEDIPQVKEIRSEIQKIL